MGFNIKIRNLLFWVFLALVVLGAASYLVSGGEVSITNIQLLAKSLGVWLPISFIIIYILASIFFPTTPLMALAGVIFGFKYGLFYTVIAGFISGMATFCLSRYLGKDMVDDWLNSKSLAFLDKYNEKIKKHGFLTVLTLRATPIMPFNVLNLIMGISKVKTFDYLMGTLLGLIPSNVLSVYFGSLIVSIIL